jgi:hypothetical protein
MDSLENKDPIFLFSFRRDFASPETRLRGYQGSDFLGGGDFFFSVLFRGLNTVFAFCRF